MLSKDVCLYNGRVSSSARFYSAQDLLELQTLQMYLISKISLALTALLAGQAIASPILATPGDANDIVITKDDTVNGTTLEAPRLRYTNTASTGTLQLSLVNNLPSSNVNAYVTGLDVNGVLVMLSPSGSWYYPSSTGSQVPVEITANVAIRLGAQGSTTNITLPGYISSARVYFANGQLKFYTVQAANGQTAIVQPSAVNPSDPSANIDWGFVELTWTAQGGLYANISYVDFVGLPLGMSLINTAGAVNTAQGVDINSIEDICEALDAQTCVDNQPWNELCVTDSSGYALRVLSPFQYQSINNTAFSTYWTSYINSVWSYYTTNTLTIDTQAAAGKVACTVSPSTNLLTCAGDNRGYAQPTAADIYGCNSGPFAIMGGDNAVHYAVVPRLCAAFHRSTFLVNGGNVQPSLGANSFYTQSPTNYYSKFVHEHEIDGRGYAFPYDDVTASGAGDSSGLLADPNPAVLKVVVGGPGY